jgi:hypothetical protein
MHRAAKPPPWCTRRISRFLKTRIFQKRILEFYIELDDDDRALSMSLEESWQTPWTVLEDNVLGSWHVPAITHRTKGPGLPKSPGLEKIETAIAGGAPSRSRSELVRMLARSWCPLPTLPTTLRFKLARLCLGHEWLRRLTRKLRIPRMPGQ